MPLTADDFKFTYDTIMNPKNNVVTRERLRQDHSRSTSSSPTEFHMVFKEVFAPFRDLWAGTSTTVLPKHVLEGQNFNKVWNTLHLRPEDEEADRSGPMMVRVVHARPAGHARAEPELLGREGAPVPKVVFIPVLDSNAEVNAFRSGEVDMIYPQNQIGLRKKIESVDGAEYTTSLGPQWEHFDMLSDRARASTTSQVRKAIATAMPRQQIVDRVVKDANDDAAVLDNTHVDDEPAAVRAELVDLPGARATSPRPTPCSTPRDGSRVATASAPKDGVKLVVHGRHHVRQPGPRARRADHPGAARRRSA